MGATILAPPQLAEWQKKALNRLKSYLPAEPDMVWMFSSGTQSVDRVKCVGLSWSAVLASAAAVNKHLQVSKKDVWSVEIPTYHIGGFAILERASMLGCRVVRAMAWDAREFATRVAREKVTLTSLVPTQVFDLISEQVQAPTCLRAAVIGGGALPEHLYAQARGLGWPILPSYGLTECASQVATASLDSLKSGDFPGLTLLPHVNVDIRDGRVWIRSPSLCKWVATCGVDGSVTLEDPLRGGWLPTEDLADWVHGEGAAALKILGRRDEIVKVLGVLVSLPQISNDLNQICHEMGVEASFVLISVDRGREGSHVLAVTDSTASMSDLQGAVDRYNSGVSGPFRIQQICWTEHIPRTALGKIKKAELRAQLRI